MGYEFCFPESPDVSRDEVEGNIRTRARMGYKSIAHEAEGRVGY